MGDKIMQFLGNHFEKLLLPVFGLLIIWLLLTKVVISPNRVEVSGEKQDAWRVDRDLRKQAEDLQIELEAEPVAKPSYASTAIQLSGLYDSALGDSTGYIAPSIPQTTSIELAVGGEYDVPVVGQLTDVAVGYVRATADLDIWVEQSAENAEAIVACLTEFGFTVEKLNPDLFLVSDRVVRMGLPPFRIELLTSISGLEFQDSYSQRIEENWSDTDICIIDLESLKVNKKAAGRHQDMDDLENLP